MAVIVEPVREKNLFAIGRSRLGPEDQLTEMLAYLWQEEPELIQPWVESLGVNPPREGEWEIATQVVDKASGRFDLVLEKPDLACIIVESKLGSGLGSSQLRSYLRYLASRPEGDRALVALTRDAVGWSTSLDAEASAVQVALIPRRWQEFAAALATPEDDTLAGDFVRMLIAEGLVMPEPFASEDWKRWNEGAQVLARLETFIAEARPALERISPGLKASGRYGLSTRWIYRLVSNDRLTIGLGFAANRSPREPDSPSIIFAPLKNLSLSGEEAKGAANTAARAVGGSVLWGDYPYLTRPVEDVLTASTFREQVDQAIDFVHATALVYQEAGYLPPEVELPGSKGAESP